ncbi:MAG: trypsin-like peptidase domain-containing protein [Bacteroidota bacterium]
MTSSRETEELIERYCKGELSVDELRIFEQWLENDPSLFEAVKDHQQVIAAFDIVADRNQIREQLNAIHDEMETEAFSFKAPLKVVKQDAKGLRGFYQRHRIISIAAAVSVVAVSGTLLTGALTGLFSTKQQSAYQALRLEVERLKRSQRAIINGINEARETPDEAVEERGFIGTGMALSQDGYILTSAHVTKGARTIYISNDKYEQLKVEEVYKDEQMDISVLKVVEDDFKSFGELPYSFKHNSAEPGERVFTLGYPRQDVVYNEGSVSSVSGFEGDTTAYQISLPVNPGNSGGPLFDSQANLVGLISGRNMTAEGASFAVQSKYIFSYLDKNAHESVAHVSKKNLKGLDRPAQIKKLKDFVFMVKVFN